MRFTSATLGAFAAAAIVASTGFLAAAATSLPHGQAGIPRAHWVNTSDPVVYVGQYENGQGNAVVQIFSQRTHKQVGQITGLGYPGAMTVDAAGNLYIADDAADHARVLVFPPGATSPSRTISEAGYETSGIDVGADGTIYLADFCQTDGVQCLGDGYTVVYPPTGSPQFIDVLGGPALVAANSTKQLVIMGDNAAPVGDFPKVKFESVASNGQGGYRELRFNEFFENTAYGRIHFDGQNRFVALGGGKISDSFLGIFKLPFPHRVGAVPLPGVAFDFAFPAGGSNVWAAMYVFRGNQEQTFAQELTYPGGKPVASFPIVNAYGANTVETSFAVSPALVH